MTSYNTKIVQYNEYEMLHFILNNIIIYFWVLAKSRKAYVYVDPSKLSLFVKVLEILDFDVNEGKVELHARYDTWTTFRPKTDILARLKTM